MEAKESSNWYAWYVVILLGTFYMLSFVDRLIVGLLVEPIKAHLGLTDTQISLVHGFSYVIADFSLSCDFHDFHALRMCRCRHPGSDAIEDARVRCRAHAVSQRNRRDGHWPAPRRPCNRPSFRESTRSSV